MPGGLSASAAGYIVWLLAGGVAVIALEIFTKGLDVVPGTAVRDFFFGGGIVAAIRFAAGIAVQHREAVSQLKTLNNQFDRENRNSFAAQVDDRFEGLHERVVGVDNCVRSLEGEMAHVKGKVDALRRGNAP